nr:hypothetical protein pPsy0479a_00055 [Pseudomonas syringae]
MSKRNDIEVVAVNLLQVRLQSCFQVDLRCIGGFSRPTMTKIKQDPAPGRKNNLRRVTVSYWIKDDLMFIRHRSSFIGNTRQGIGSTAECHHYMCHLK